MHIIILGVDHTSASIALRERLTCFAHQVPQMLRAVHQEAQECVLLSTCNRFELYAVYADRHSGRAHLLHTLSEMRGVPVSEIEECGYDFFDEQAVTHLFEVACGLHSLVPGEPQIQGQVAEAMEIAQGGGYAGPILSALFRAALVAGKRARSETGISRNATSISHVAVQLARAVFPRLQEASVLLIGSGKMSELAAQNLCENGVERLIIINRTLVHAVDLAQRYGAVHRSFTELSATLAQTDVVISSTTAPHAILTLDMMQRVMEQRNGRALLLIDIALPRDAEPAVGELPGVYLYNLDDLETCVNEGIRLRLQEVEQVQAIISEEARNFDRWLRSLSVVGTISDLRRRADALRQQELARTMQQLSSSLSEREAAAVNELTTRLMNKLLHAPTLRLKDAAAGGRGHLYSEALRYLFDLEEKKDQVEQVEQKYEANRHWNTGKQASNGANALGGRADTTAMAGSGDGY